MYTCRSHARESYWVRFEASIPSRLPVAVHIRLPTVKLVRAWFPSFDTSRVVIGNLFNLCQDFEY